MTLDDMVDEALTTLQSYGLTQPSMTTLSAGCTDTATTLALTNVIAGAGPGVAEVESEVVMIQSVNRETSVATVIRGLRSDAAAHLAGATVTFNPPWPRVMVANAVNDAIVGSYPTLFGVATETFTASAVVNTYDMNPLDDKVLEVSFQSIGPTLEWLPLTNYRLDDLGGVKKLTIWDLLTPTRTVSVRVQRKPSRLALADELTTSGLQASAKEYCILMACAKLTANLDTARLPDSAASPDTWTPFRVTGSATNVSTSLLRLAEFELARERKRLQQAYPPTITFARRGGFYHR